MEDTDDIFADLLSGLQPKTTQREPTAEELVSMEENRRRAMSDTEVEGVQVRRSASPVGENLKPPPPPLTKDEVQQLIRENVRELLFQSFGALTSTLRSALSGVTEKIATVDSMHQELNTKVEQLLEKQGNDSHTFTESFRHVEATLKEASVGIQRMLEKQDLVDAHVLLNRHAREDQDEKRREEVEDVKKSEKRVTFQKETVEEPLEEEEEEEENPPVRVPPKKKTQGMARPVARVQEQQTMGAEVEQGPYQQEGAVEVKQPAPVYHPPAAQTAQLPRQMENVPRSYAMENRQQQQPQPALPPQPPPQPALPPQQAQQMPLPSVHPPQQISPVPLPQQNQQTPIPQQPSFPAPPQASAATQEYKPPPPSYNYANHGLGQNGYTQQPQHAADKPSPPPYPQQMPPPPMSQFGTPPPPQPTQHPPPMHSSTLQPPPGHYMGYPSLPAQQPYRPAQPPPPPPPQQTFYGSPPPPQNPKTPQRAPDSTRTSSQSIPLDQVITDVANMGFDRTKVRSVVTDLLDHGESIDLNVVIDRLTRF